MKNINKEKTLSFVNLIKSFFGIAQSKNDKSIEKLDSSIQQASKSTEEFIDTMKKKETENNGN